MHFLDAFVLLLTKRLTCRVFAVRLSRWLGDFMFGSNEFIFFFLAVLVRVIVVAGVLNNTLREECGYKGHHNSYYHISNDLAAFIHPLTPG